MAKKFSLESPTNSTGPEVYHVIETDDENNSRVVAECVEKKHAEMFRNLLSCTQPVSTVKLTEEQIDYIAEILRLCGQYRDPRDRLVEKMAREHRTIQQLYMAFVVAFIERMSQNHHDMRNEAAVQFAQIVMSEIPYEQRVMPYI